jgi:hypothetical protein
MLRVIRTSLQQVQENFGAAGVDNGMFDGCLLLVDRANSIASIKIHTHGPLPRDFPTPSHVAALCASYNGKLTHLSLLLSSHFDVSFPYTSI